MFEKALIFYLYAETPLHPGSGSSINSPVDLPIQRERHTDFPMIQGSSMKGVLRAYAKEIGFTDDDVIKIFGAEGEEAGAGYVSVTDARILAFPVRTLAGVFGWITCPLILNRYKRDLTIANAEVAWNIPSVEKPNVIIVKDDSNIKIGQSVYIEEAKLISKSANGFDAVWAAISQAVPGNKEYDFIRNKINVDLGIVDDEVFRDMASLTTEVTARIAIDQNTGAVKRGALWYEEALPTDSLMYSLILLPKRFRNGCTSSDIVNKLLNFNGKVINVGGDETIGRGFVRVRVVSC
ncbi:MAG: type III-B CRISPR module RAMP protein Cmr4 [Candidatus Bathyarchaeota archaeon]|nr:type III-B CRISPR module RAMP protein Cmr4 [Candidatus Bathyarchaeota archaeon]